MYKVFSGEKCIMIADTADPGTDKHVKAVAFSSAEELHKEYLHFARNFKLKTLLVSGKDPDRIWRVFSSLFVFIEAAGGVVKNRNKDLLMIYRNRHWDLPKGKIEKGESPEKAAVREVEEECGIAKLEIVKPITSVYHIYFENGKEYLKRTYWYEMLSKDTATPKPQVEEGIKEAKWMSPQDVKKNSGKMYPSLRQLLSSVVSS